MYFLWRTILVSFIMGAVLGACGINVVEDTLLYFLLTLPVVSVVYHLEVDYIKYTTPPKEHTPQVQVGHIKDLHPRYTAIQTECEIIE